MEIAKSRPTRFCTICGADSSSEATFCRSCGKVLEIPLSPVGTVYCQRCGGELSMGDAYCPKCGDPQSPSALTKADAAAPPASAPAAGPVAFAADAVFEQVGQAPNILLRLLWFLFIGSWLGPLLWVVACLALITYVGIPIGLQLIHTIPYVVTLKPDTRRMRFRRQTDGSVVATEVSVEQLPFKTRALYFGFVGWWFSFLWIVLAWTLAVMILPIPVAMWMYGRLPFFTTLEQD